MVLSGPPLAPSNPISFSDFDASAVHFSHNDDLIIIMLIGNCRVSKILVNGGSSVNVLYGGPRQDGRHSINRPSDDKSSNPVSSVWV